MMLRTVWVCAVDQSMQNTIEDCVYRQFCELSVQHASYPPVCLGPTLFDLIVMLFLSGHFFRVHSASIKISAFDSAELSVLNFHRFFVLRPTIGVAQEVSWPAESVGATPPQYVYTSFLNSWHRLVALPGKLRVLNRQRTLLV